MTKSHEQFINDVQARNDICPLFKIAIKPGSTYSALDTPMEFQCVHGHPDFTTRPRYIIQKNSGCPQCRKQKVSTTLSKGTKAFVEDLKLVAPTLSLMPGQRYINTNTQLSFRCDIGHIFNALPKNLLQDHGCMQCANISKRLVPKIYAIASNATRVQCEIDVLTKALNVNVIVIPLQRTTNKWHYAKMAEAIRTDKQHTVFLFEDEWTSNRNLITSKLSHYGHANTSPVIHARKCIIKAVSIADKRSLLVRNHVQGNDNAPITYGAYHNDQLVALMSFTAPRVILGQKGDRAQYTGQWELSRFCTETNVRIPGIAGKLLKHFQRLNEWTEIYSYADRRWSLGTMYTALGFKLVGTNPPSYAYVVDGKRKHRWTYRKDALKNTLANYDPDLTEHQNMANHGFQWVWDCGTLKFSINNCIGS